MKFNFSNDLVEISHRAFLNEDDFIKTVISEISRDFRYNLNVANRAAGYIDHIRKDSNFGVEQLLHRFSLRTAEGVSLLYLAESLLRIPDEKLASKLIIDRLAHKNWGQYLRFAKSRIVELGSVGLYLMAKLADLKANKSSLYYAASTIIDWSLLNSLKIGIKFLGNEFVLGENPESAFRKARAQDKFLYSFDVLGESSRTEKEAKRYFDEYIRSLSKIAFYFPGSGENLYERPNLSVKLSALYPRVEAAKIKDIDNILIPRLTEIIEKCKEHRVTITFDAEEAKRQDIYLYVLTKIISMKEFHDFNGIGIVVQAYQKRAPFIIEHFASIAKKLNKVIPIRLVKGAYWDSEIKYAQENGIIDYPVFTKKEYTDANYIFCAQKIYEAGNVIYPQFAGHNATTISNIIEMFGDRDYELQKLHGMGNSLFSKIVKERKVRIYAPIGKMEDLLAYLMRRLLENGANNSFVNKINEENVDVRQLIQPISEQAQNALTLPRVIRLAKDIYNERTNSQGIDLGYFMNIEKMQEELGKFVHKVYVAGSIINGKEIISPKHSKEIFRPGNSSQKVGEICYAKKSELTEALSDAEKYFPVWSETNVESRAKILYRIAEMLEDNKFELYSLLLREGGKTLQDAIAEVREAIDFCNYYALQAEKIISDKMLPGPVGELNCLSWHPRGVFLCISPWNFPLAIFLGQIVAALVAGNCVLCKPADQTSLIANYVVKLMYNAGVPKGALHLTLARGSVIGETFISDERIKGVVFTGSTETAKNINLTIASREGAIIPLIAETGGQNAMIVDSSALLEQVCDDAIHSAFYSAGQRCSALRVLYVQEEIYDKLLDLIVGAMEQIKVGDTIDLSVDMGPVIDENSKQHLQAHIDKMKQQGFNVITQSAVINNSVSGSYINPHIIEINSINDLESENFGPVLHICKYKSDSLPKIIDDINNYGYGLTFGIQSRIESQIEYISSKIKTGNIYVNRTIIGAQVESQPFGGENKSGTGFKAGGPHYLLKFMTERALCVNLTAVGGNIELLK